MTTNTGCLMFTAEDDKKICVSTLLSHSNPTDITLRRNTNCFKLTDIVRNNFCNGLSFSNSGEILMIYFLMFQLYWRI